MIVCRTSSYLVVVVSVVPRETDNRSTLLWTSVLFVQIALIQTRKKLVRQLSAAIVLQCLEALIKRGTWVFKWLPNCTGPPIGFCHTRVILKVLVHVHDVRGIHSVGRDSVSICKRLQLLSFVLSAQFGSQRLCSIVTFLQQERH